MEIDTDFFTSLGFARWEGHPTMESHLVFVQGICIQHLIFAKGNSLKDDPDFFDVSNQSMLIGQRLRTIQKSHPEYHEDIWDVPIMFFEREDNPQTWIAGRLEFLKEFTCDNPFPMSVIKALQEAKVKYG